PAIPGAASAAVIETEQYAVVDQIGEGLAGQRGVATSTDGGQLYVLLDASRLVAYDLLTRARRFDLTLPTDVTRLAVVEDRLVAGGRTSDGKGQLTMLDAATGRTIGVVT